MRVVPGEIFGYAVETDEFTPLHGVHGTGIYESEVFVSVDFSQEVKHFKLNLEKYLEKISKAIREVNLMNIPVERVTIIGGVVQAHPPALFHWRCPFCYPENGS